MSIQNIFCIGRNYKLHAQELNNAVPTSPLVFTKPTHALTEAKGQMLRMPSNQGEVHYEVELVLHLTRAYEPGIKLEDLMDQIAIGLDFTLRDVQDELKKKGYPWLAAKGFPNSAVLSSWIPFEGIQALRDHDFVLEKNGVEVQRGNINDMIFDLPTITEFIARNYGLGAGDVIFTGTPSGVGALADGDHLVLKWKEEVVGECFIAL